MGCRRTEKRSREMYDNRHVYVDVEDNDYSNEIVFRKLPPLPIMENNRPTDTGKAESCFRKNWSIACKAWLLGLIVLLFILLIIVCALFSAASVQVKEEKQSLKNIQVTVSAAPVQVEEEKQSPKNIQVTEPQKNTCPLTWKRIGDNCYSFSGVTKNWQGASDTCTQQQSKLLILTSKKEMDSLLPSMNGRAYWIGLKKINTAWLWSDATPLTFSNWNPNEPNNAGGNEFCVEMKREGWNDLNCDTKLHYICKKW